jgi:hypothetical protein
MNLRPRPSFATTSLAASRFSMDPLFDISNLLHYCSRAPFRTSWNFMYGVPFRKVRMPNPPNSRIARTMNRPPASCPFLMKDFFESGEGAGSDSPTVIELSLFIESGQNLGCRL